MTTVMTKMVTSYVKRVLRILAFRVYTERKNTPVSLQIAFQCILGALLFRLFISFITHHIVTFCTDKHGFKCIDISLHMARDIWQGYYKWKLGPCHVSYKSQGIYTDQCCVPYGDNWFSCSPDYRDGSNEGVIKIGRHQFCDDFVGFNQLITLNFPGNMTNDISYSYMYIYQ